MEFYTFQITLVILNLYKRLISSLSQTPPVPPHFDDRNIIIKGTDVHVHVDSVTLDNDDDNHAAFTESYCYTVYKSP